ncbi:MAG: sensor histidine kinase KdpD [Spirochaetaceae bacterium]|nr:MAG: sensor histidine kinase KdpD [Spirochaetaceae bacterium]
MVLMERILACISAAPSSRNVILKAAEMAERVPARVVALHVQLEGDSPRVRRERVLYRAEIERNLALAREIGAEVATVSGNDIVGAIIEYAELARVSHIVVGKNERTAGAGIRRRLDVAQRLIAETTQIDVHVVPGDPSDYRARPRRRRQVGLRQFPRGIAVTLGLIGAAALLSTLLRSVGFADANIVMVFLVAVLAITFVAGRLQGIIASMLGVLAFNYLFTEPRFTLVVYDTQYVLTFVVMLLVALSTSELLSRVRLEAVISRRRADRTVAVYRLSRALLTVSGEEAVMDQALDQLVRYYGGLALWYNGNPAEGALPVVRSPRGTTNEPAGLAANGAFNAGDREQQAAVWAYCNARTTGAGDAPFAECTRFYAPLLSSSGVLGVLAVTIAESSEATAEQRTLMETFAGQVALALERERFARRHEQAKIEVEAERLKNYLLRSISHDLRTPLAGIAGSAAVLLDMNESQVRSQVRELAGDIHEQATWLTGLVENLLSLTRIESDSPGITFQRETVDDLVGSVLARMRRRLEPFNVTPSLPESVVSVPMDAGLIEQVLMNLLDNACRHSSSGAEIRLDVVAEPDAVSFAVTDSGPGFAPQDLQHLFKKFYTGRHRDADSARGVGLGLAICRAIVDAHGGSIEASNADAGGARVCFRLPLQRPAGETKHEK